GDAPSTPGSQPLPTTKRESPAKPLQSLTLPAGSSIHATTTQTQPPAGAIGSPSGSAKSAFGGPLASPETRKVARDLGVDTAQLAGSGEHGRITRDDVLRAAAPSTSASGRPPSSALP